MLKFLASVALILSTLPAAAQSFSAPAAPEYVPDGWVGRQKMPDNIRQSCCGPGDAYEVDRVLTGPNGEFYAVITDTRPDEPLNRPHIEPGTLIQIPDFKIIDPRGDINTTGHGWIWVRTTDWWVYCFSNPPGDG